MIMVSVAKIVAPMLLAGESMRSPSLQSFHALVVSPKGYILGFLTEPLVWFLSPSIGAQGLAAFLGESP
jgi:hypothetical protein